MRAPIRIAISSCLLGQEVRYDGGQKRDALLVDTFGPYVEWVPVCPELEMGLGVPREPIHLVSAPSGNHDSEIESRALGKSVPISSPVRLVGVQSGRDHTAAMQKYARRRLEELAEQDPCGYILKSRSPSCGLMRVKVWNRGRAPASNGRGMFAAALVERFPYLPVDEEGRLSDARLRENFVERVFAYSRLKGLFAGRWTAAQLVAFHAAHELQLIAHSPDGCRRLGRLAGSAASVGRQDLRSGYRAGFMETLAVPATRARHANVLRHTAGRLQDLDRTSREELQRAIAHYRAGLVPLIVPITLMRHHARRLDVPELQSQSYLEPHPLELMLRNHV